jgi:hypothetical protein
MMSGRSESGTSEVTDSATLCVSIALGMVVQSAMPSAFRLALTGRVRGTWYVPKTGDDGSFSLLLFEVGKPDGSWAASVGDGTAHR